MAFVQAFTFTTGGPLTSLAIDLTSSNPSASADTTSGNALYAIVAVRSGMEDSVSTPAGWTIHGTPRYTTEDGTLSYVVYTRIADGTETEFALSWSTAGRTTAAVIECDGAGTLTFGTPANDTTYIVTDTTTVPTGTATATAENGTAIAVLLEEIEANWDAVAEEIDGGYNIDVTQLTSGSGSYPAMCIASLPFTSSGAKSATWSTTDIGSEAAGMMLLVYDDAVVSNDPPVATAQSVSTPINTPLAITLSGTDSDGTIASYQKVSDPTDGVLSGTIPNYTYTPDTDFTGTDSFNFTVTDDDGEVSTAATITITVSATVDVTDYDITATFSGADSTSAYVSNGHAIVATNGTTVTLESYTPAWDGDANGAMVNPVGGTSVLHGWDNRAGQNLSGIYDSGLNIALSLPMVLNVGDSIMISRGIPTVDLDDVKESMAAMLVIRVVASAPAANAFRPPYSGELDITHTAADLDYTILPNLDQTLISSKPSLSALNALFARNYTEHNTEAPGDYEKPTEHQMRYGRDISYDVNELLLSACLDYTEAEKEAFLLGFIQYGIDIYGVAVSGGHWRHNGGINQGRKPPLLLAALMLDDSAMLAVAQNQSPKKFHEDEQIFTVQQSDVDLTRLTPDDRHRDPFLTKHIGQVWWGQKQLTQPNVSKSNWYTSVNATNTAGTAMDLAAYNRVSGSAQLGAVLAFRLMDQTAAWNNDDWFYFFEDLYWSAEYDVARGALNAIQTFDGEMWDNFGPTPDANVFSGAVNDNNDTLSVTISVIGGGLYCYVNTAGTGTPSNANIIDGTGAVFHGSMVGHVWEGDGGQPNWPIQQDFDASAVLDGGTNYDVYFLKSGVDGVTTTSVLYGASNSAPTATSQSVTAQLNTAKAITLAGVDSDGTISSGAYEQPANGTVTGTYPSVTYTPDTDFTGADSFTFTVTDDDAAESTNGTVTINVNDLPVADAQSVSVTENIPKAITITGTDSDGTLASAQLISDGANGSVVIVGLVATYTPDTDYTGSDSFTVKVTDNDGGQSTAAATITITVAEAPASTMIRTLEPKVMIRALEPIAL